jgi:dTDP-4-dehydrorhamnose reductase
MRLLILGVNGMLGHKLWQRLSPAFADSYGTLRTARTRYAACELLQTPRVLEHVDAGDFARVAEVLAKVQPDVIVNCVALTKRRDTPALDAIEINAALPHRLADWASSHRKRLVHFSTDCVFDGRQGGYTEASATNAVDVYGKTKALGEVSGPGILTLRTSFVGRELDRCTELLEWFLAQRGRRIRGYRQAIYSGVSTDYMAQLLTELLVRFPRLEGLYQIAAPAISKYELLCLAREAYNVPVDIEPDDTVVVRRDLDGTKFRQATGFAVPAWPQMMRELALDPTPYERWKRKDASR